MIEIDFFTVNTAKVKESKNIFMIFLDILLIF
jgi:hypothetical protein